MVSLVYSFSVEAISNFKPNLSHNFFDRYSPIPVAFALFLFEPVKPFSNTRDKSDAFIPQPIIFNHKQYICTIVLTVYRQLIFLLIKILNRILHDLR